MGHREQLLEGAKRCLSERGYARTTARDIVAASGANLASIGYHFGSKEALLDAALIDAMREMTDQLYEVEGMRTDLASGLVLMWDRIVDEFDTYRPLLVAQVEAWAQLERSEAVRERFAEHNRSELERGVEYTREVLPELDASTVRAVCAVIGLVGDGLIVQWLVDPDGVPSGAEIAKGMRAMADLFERADEGNVTAAP